MRSVILLILGVAALAAPCLAQPLDAQIEGLGFPTNTMTGAVVRAGQWFPIRVLLSVQGTGAITRGLRFEGIDLDGDRVAFVQPQIALSGEGGARQRRVWCYGIVNSVTTFPPTLDVLDERGASVLKVPLAACELISNDDLLILDISSEPILAFERLRGGSATVGERGEGQRAFYRNVVTSRLPAGFLPDRWFGLEAVDVVVWDRPDPKQLSLAQLDALVTWVRQGGQLIVGIGTAWDALRGSALEPILPVQGEGRRDEVTRLPVFTSRLAAPSWRKDDFSDPVALTHATLAPDALATFRDSGPQGAVNLITMRPVGSGRVVALAASLRDLSRAVRLDEVAFCTELIDVNSYTDKFRESQAAMVPLGEPALYLYRWFVKPIGFGTRTALFGLIAFLFIGGYIAVATIAAWWWLRAKHRAHLNWTVFAGLATAASVLSLGTVSLFRGISGGVQSFSVLDLEAGSAAARGTVLFGYHSSIGRRADLALTGDGNFVRPLAENPGQSRDYYVTPARYTANPARARLNDVPVRATLKQLEGRWTGNLDGALRAQLTLDRGTGRPTPESWIVNELGVDLAGAYLFYVDPRLMDGVGVPRPAGRTAPYKGLPLAYEMTRRDLVESRLDFDLKQVPPAWNILSLQLPALPSGARQDRLGAAIYKDVDERWERWAGGGGRQLRRKDMPDLPTLWHAQQAWRPALIGGALDEPLRAVLLASLRDYHLHSSSGEFDRADLPLDTNGLPPLNIAHWLIQGREADDTPAGYAVLIAWAGAPGPAALQLDGAAAEAEKGLTVYRVRIPVHYTGQVPGE